MEVKTAIEWTGQLQLGIPEIDAQHRAIVRLLNDLQSSIEDGLATECVKQAVRDLVAYTGQHLDFEESCFRKFSYEDTEAHVAEHRRFRRKIEDMVNKLYNSGSPDYTALAHDLWLFLKDWLMTHIRVSDKHYVDLFKKFGM